MKEIPLFHQDKVTIVDNYEFEWLSQFKWLYKTGGYIRRLEWNGRQISFYMHREIMNAPVGMVVDHIDRNPLNNQRSNLRICTIPENLRNYKIAKNNTSGYMGVSIRKTTHRWEASIMVNRLSIHLGYFRTAKDAAIARDEAAKKYFGEFAHLNFGGSNDL